MGQATSKKPGSLLRRTLVLQNTGQKVRGPETILAAGIAFGLFRLC